MSSIEGENAQLCPPISILTCKFGMQQYEAAYLAWAAHRMGTRPSEESSEVSPEPTELDVEEATEPGPNTRDALTITNISDTSSLYLSTASDHSAQMSAQMSSQMNESHAPPAEKKSDTKPISLGIGKQQWFRINLLVVGMVVPVTLCRAILLYFLSVGYHNSSTFSAEIIHAEKHQALVLSLFDVQQLFNS